MRANEFLIESWSQKYKNSINCSHPKGFSQKAHCAGKKKHNEDITMETVCPPSIAIPELKTEQIEKDVRCFPQYPVPVYSSPSEAFCVDPIEIVDGQPVYTGSITLLNCDNTDLFGSALTITVDDTSVSGEPAGAITVNIRSK